MSKKDAKEERLKKGMILSVVLVGFIIGFLLLQPPSDRCPEGSEYIEERGYCEGPPACPDGWRWSEVKQRCEVFETIEEAPATAPFTIVPETRNMR